MLWRSQELGYRTGQWLLFQASMLFVGLIIVLLVQPSLNPEPLALVDIFVIYVMGMICFIPFPLLARGVVANDSLAVVDSIGVV